MLKTIIVLPDGTEISSGSNAENAIKNVSLTECVNSGDELTIGSACANALEVTLITPASGLTVPVGTDVAVYKDESGNRTKIGVFTLEKPTRPTANTMKLTGYDHVAKLDKDLTQWLNSLTGWPYTLIAFAGMVCAACGLTFKAADVPNGGFPVNQFTRSSVTGRQLMQWLGQICCRFCRANVDGDIEFAWYTDSGKEITPSGELYYFQNGLTYENYQTAPVDAVQIRLADSENGALWPTAPADANAYIISGNAILDARITEDLAPVLANILDELKNVSYTPCKVSMPAILDIRAGTTVHITDKNGASFVAYVMTKKQTGQKDTLECTGSYRRDSTTAANNQSQSAAAASAARGAFDGMTQEQIFNKLTDNGKIQGLYVQDGKWYINAEVAQIINLITNHLLSKTEKAKLEISGAELTFTTSDGSTFSVNNYSDRAIALFKSSGGDGLYLSSGRVGVGKNAGSTPEAGLISRSNTGAGSLLFVEEISWTNNDDSPPFKFLGKKAAWKSNGDGTFTLVGS